MRLHVYIYGNSVGEISAIRLPDGACEMTWDKDVISAVENLGVKDSCCIAIIELFKGGYSFATFGEGVGELRVV